MDYYAVGRWALQPVSTGQSTGQPVTVAELRSHLRLETTSASDAEDPLLLSKIAAARGQLESHTNRQFVRGQFDLAIERFPRDGSCPIRLPVSPLVSVDQVTWFDREGTAQTFSSSGYFVDAYSAPGRLVLLPGIAWPWATRDHVGGVVRFTAGYAPSSEPTVGIPDPLREAVLKLATELYENREGVSLGNSINQPLPLGIDELVAPFVLQEAG